MFHVEQCPIQRMSPLPWPTAQDCCRISAEYLDRETPGQIGQPADRLTVQVYGISRGTAFNAHRGRTVGPCRNPPDQSIGRLAVTNRLVGDVGAKRPNPAEGINRFKQTGLA